MKILLDRDEVYKIVEEVTNEAIEKHHHKSTIQKSIIYELSVLKPAAAAPIVRCEDCAFVDSLECRLNYIDKQRLIFTNRAPDWYCADGRPKGWEDEI